MSETKKEGFLLFTKQKAMFEKMSNEQAGILIKAIYEYEDTGKIPDLEFGLEIAFTSIKTTLDENRVKYQEVSKKRSEAARSKRKQKEQLQANVNFESKSNCIDNESDSDNESDISNNDYMDDGCVDDPFDYYLKNISLSNNLLDHEFITLQELQEKLGNELLIYAMKKAIEANVKKLNYIKAISNNWIKENVTTIEAAEKINQKFKPESNIRQLNFEFMNQKNGKLDALYEN